MTTSDKTDGMMSVALLLGLGLLAAAAAFFLKDPLPRPDPAVVGWKTYANDTVGYTFEYPDVYTVTEYSDGAVVILRQERTPRVLVSFVTEGDGQRQGIWFAHEPDGEITLGGREGQHYLYTHYDGPFGDPTEAYVVPWRDRMLGLEFRRERPIDALDRRTLESFRFLER